MTSSVRISVSWYDSGASKHSSPVPPHHASPWLGQWNIGGVVTSWLLLSRLHWRRRFATIVSRCHRTVAASPEPAPPSVTSTLVEAAQVARATLGAWGSRIGIFIASRASKLSAVTSASTSPVGTGAKTPTGDNSRPQSRSFSVVHG